VLIATGAIVAAAIGRGRRTFRLVAHRAGRYLGLIRSTRVTVPAPGLCDFQVRQQREQTRGVEQLRPTR